MQLNNKNVETEAKVLKTKGNDAFKQGKFDFAIRYYSDAVILSANDSEKSVLLSNRAAAQLKLQQYNEALKDCNEALAYDPNLVKALFRKALALEGLREIANARAASREALQLEPTNPSLLELAARLGPLPSLSDLTKRNLQRSMLPKLFATAPFHQVPSIDTIDENLLLLLHGLGDNPRPFSSLAKTLELPQTSYLALGAPHEVPLSDGGRSWFTVWDPTFELIEGRQGEERRIRSMHSTIDGLEQLLMHLNVHCGWDSRKIHLFGFSQGGTVAMELARRCAAQGKVLGSCVAIASGLLEEQLYEEGSFNDITHNSDTKDKLPVLLLHGDKDAVVSRRRVGGTEALLKSEGFSVELHSIPGKGHAMLNSETETRIVMEFWAKHLSNRPTDDSGHSAGAGGCHVEEPQSSLIEIAPGVASISLG
ncbi:hypothetical protein Ndes2526B_g00472 [Nannochloris sp. 'desiccata']|nr:hypothetical protein KSW81_003242 [Chlorella desiccata (nom. nud.)]KAH7625088.1 putative Stress-induced-phosphoprotein 1 [Chlorella desiccata (nom. nud.)]